MYFSLQTVINNTDISEVSVSLGFIVFGLEKKPGRFVLPPHLWVWSNLNMSLSNIKSVWFVGVPLLLQSAKESTLISLHIFPWTSAVFLTWQHPSFPWAFSKSTSWDDGRLFLSNSWIADSYRFPRDCQGERRKGLRHRWQMLKFGVFWRFGPENVRIMWWRTERDGKRRWTCFDFRRCTQWFTWDAF